MVTAMSGVELALWDLAGKAAGVPIYRLMGGKLRDRIRIFQDCGAGDWGWADRESVVEGKSGDIGGRRIIKKKKNKITIFLFRNSNIIYDKRADPPTLLVVHDQVDLDQRFLNTNANPFADNKLYHCPALHIPL